MEREIMFTDPENGELTQSEWDQFRAGVEREGYSIVGSEPIEKISVQIVGRKIYIEP